MTTTSRFKVRFSLERKTYMKWIVKEGNQSRVLSPDEVSLLLEGCRMVNRQSIAKAINKGADKRVCAWIEAENVTILPAEAAIRDITKYVRFDPRHTPHWTDEDDTNIDGNQYSSLLTKGRRVYKN
jgi:hypothetical protein